MTKKLIFQGAEAKIFINPLHKDLLHKERIQKTYRHKKLDEKIRKSRTKAEVKLLTKAFSTKANVPKIISQDKYKIILEKIQGDKLSDKLNSYDEKKQLEVMKKLGEQVTIIHDNNIIHGDLTTSNMILQSKTEKLYLIDFGLGFIGSKIEDKAVDIHLLKQAIVAKHFQNHEDIFKAFLKSYTPKEKLKILERLKAVEKRGKNKAQH